MLPKQKVNQIRDKSQSVDIALTAHYSLVLNLTNVYREGYSTNPLNVFFSKDLLAEASL